MYSQLRAYVFIINTLRRFKKPYLYSLNQDNSVVDLKSIPSLLLPQYVVNLVKTT